MAPQGIHRNRKYGPIYALYLAILCIYVLYLYAYLFERAASWRVLCKANRRCMHFMRLNWPIRTQGYELDTADNQWREFRASLPLLSIVAAIHGVASHVARSFCSEADSKVIAAVRTRLNLCLTILYLVVIHGAHSLFPLLFAYISYMIGCKLAGTSACVFVTWIYGVSMLWIKEYHHRSITFSALLGSVGRPLDRVRGMHPWHLTFNLIVLRLISFNMDLHWARRSSLKDKSAGTSEKGEQVDTLEPLSDRGRIRLHRPPESYSVVSFISYVFYIPLYIAGPVITFNSFDSYMHARQKETKASLIYYTLRLCLAFTLIEGWLRCMPVFAMAGSGIFRYLSLSDLTLFTYAILTAMWLKFLIIWRFGRLWARLDGVNPPENMTGCIAGSSSVALFWKRWHCSYNSWLVRYMYIPLGGRENRSLAVLVIFVFVALWHDITPALVVWGLMNAVFMVIEGGVQTLYHRLYPNGLGKGWAIERVVHGIGGTLSIMLLIIGNITGFAVGLGGLEFLGSELALDFGTLKVVWAVTTALFAATQCLFVIDEWRGKDAPPARLKP